MTALRPRRPRIYLAGPDVFFGDCAARFARLKAACEALGLEGVEPSDGDVPAGFEGSDDERARRIYEGNLQRLRDADGVLANLADFRGLEPDSGTVFEVGFAAALGKPVAAYGVRPGSYAERVGAALNCERDASGTLRERANGTMVEGLGQRLNLMLTGAARVEATASAALEILAATLVPRQPQPPPSRERGG